MAIGKLDVFKAAIGKVSGVTISGTNEDSREAKACRDMWEQSLEEALFEHSWSSTIYRAQLQKLVGNPPHGYGNRFQLPSDYNRLIQAYYDTSNDSFDFEWQLVGKEIWTDSAAVYIKYVRIPQNLEGMSPPFIAVLTQRLAYRICYQINRKADREGQLLDEYEKLILPRAKAQDSMESRFIEFEESPWVERMYAPDL